jgi:hypothetical protein
LQHPAQLRTRVYSALKDAETTRCTRACPQSGHNSSFDVQVIDIARQPSGSATAFEAAGQNQKGGANMKSFDSLQARWVAAAILAAIVTFAILMVTPMWIDRFGDRGASVASVPPGPSSAARIPIVPAGVLPVMPPLSTADACVDSPAGAQTGRANPGPSIHWWTLIPTVAYARDSADERERENRRAERLTPRCGLRLVECLLSYSIPKWLLSAYRPATPPGTSVEGPGSGSGRLVSGPKSAGRC